MKSELTTDRLIHAINNQLEGYTAEDALNILRTDYGFTDDEIHAMGFDYLFDLVEPDEPNEPEKKTWKVHVRETWEGDFEVEAADWDEAYALACDLEYASADLNYTNREIEVTEYGFSVIR